LLYICQTVIIIQTATTMIREKTIEKIVKEFIAKEMTVDAAFITRETNLVNDLNADSMDIVNVVTAIESRFKITFPDESKIKYDGYTLQFLMDGISSALQEQAPRAKRKNKEAASEVE